jgi:hypothetical protein
MPLFDGSRITHNANILNFHEKVDDCVYVRNIFVIILIVTIASSCHIIKCVGSFFYT